MNVILIGTVIVVVFCIWKFWIEPRMNEGKPTEPDEDEETFEEQMRKATNPNVNF